MSCPTQKRLIDAAEKLFAEKGFDAVSVREIATAADANIAAINYHFQGKERLYQEVLRRQLVAKRSRMMERITAVVDEADGDPDAQELIHTFVRTFLEDAITHPGGLTVMRLVAREVIEPRYGAVVVYQELIMHMHGNFAALLAHALPDVPRDRVFLIVASLLSQVVHFVMRWQNLQADEVTPEIAEVFRQTFPVLAESKEDYIETVIDHVTEFTLGGIEAIRQGSSE